MNPHSGPALAVCIALERLVLGSSGLELCWLAAWIGTLEPVGLGQRQGLGLSVTKLAWVHLLEGPKPAAPAAPAAPGVGLDVALASGAGVVPVAGTAVAPAAAAGTADAVGFLATSWCVSVVVVVCSRGQLQSAQPQGNSGNRFCSRENVLVCICL